MLPLILTGEVYAPDARGPQSVLVVGEKIGFIGAVDARRYVGLDVPCEVVDAAGCLVTPGLIDPHQYLIGAGGEPGFAHAGAAGCSGTGNSRNRANPDINVP